MLKNFSFQNFKSFRDNAVLDLTPTKISEFSEHVMQVGGSKCLPVTAIYGANASGKSNVYQAFDYMTYYVVHSFKFGGDDDTKERSEFSYIKPTPFLFSSESKNQESLFEVDFLETKGDTAKLFNYGFAVNSLGVTKEWFKIKSKTARTYKTVFYRNIEDSILDLSGLPEKYRQNIKISLEKEVLIASLGAKLKIPKLKNIRDWFIDNEFADFGDPFESLFLSRMLPEEFAESAVVQNDVVQFFSSFDDSIKGFKVEKIPSSDSEDKDDQYTIDAMHSILNSDETIGIPLRYESDGTLKMFALYPRLQAVLKQGSVLFVDELNARLHPLLVRNFIQVFLNSTSNPNKAQLVFTTHDTWQLASDYLRRDEIWFTLKDYNGISVLYSLADCVDAEGIKIRKDENYEKNYLQGKYMAVPAIKNFELKVDDRK